LLSVSFSRFFDVALRHYCRQRYYVFAAFAIDADIALRATPLIFSPCLMPLLAISFRFSRFDDFHFRH